MSKDISNSELYLERDQSILQTIYFYENTFKIIKMHFFPSTIDQKESEDIQYYDETEEKLPRERMFKG